MEQYIEQYGYRRKTKNYKEGYIEGCIEAKKEAAINMKKKGFSEAVIADILEMNLNTIQQWIS